MSAPGTEQRPLQEEVPGGTGALVFGILGLTILPFLGSVLAIKLGGKAAEQSALEQERYTDRLGRAGRLLGWVGLIFFGGLFLVMAIGELLLWII